MKETIRKARKQHKCEWCNGIIYPGNKYLEVRTRFPKGDDDDQTGIVYYLGREHLNDKCKGRLEFITAEQYRNIITKCNKGQHEFEEDYQFDGYGDFVPTGKTLCVNCGKQKM